MHFKNFFNNYSPINNFSNSNNQQTSQRYYNNNNRSLIINKLLNDANNYLCFDCHRQTNSLQYFDVKNAIFLCYNCALNHTRLPIEVTEIISGDIRTLDEKYLLALYYGGNKNLIEFIRRYYPLLERIERNFMYSTKAMNYYRQLINSKILNGPEPVMPRKLEGYNSIFQNKINPIYENNFKNYKNEKMDLDEVKNNTNNYYNYGRNDLRNYKNENVNIKKEPAIINGQNDSDMDIEMKDESNSSQKSNDSTNEDIGAISDKENKTQNKKNYKIKNKWKENKIEKNEDSNNLTINQLGELSMYPDAKEIDGMD